MNNIYFFKMISTAVNFSISIVLGILVPKAIGPLAYGQFSYIVSTYTFLFQFLMLTSGSAYIYFLSISKYRIEQVNTFYMSFLGGVTLIVIIITLLSINAEWGGLYLWDGISDKSLIYLGLIFGCLTNFQQRIFEFCDSTNQSILADKMKVISKVLLGLSISFLVFVDKLNVYLLMLVSILNIVLYFVLFLNYLNFKISCVTRIEIKNIYTDFYLYLRPLFFFSVVAAVYSYLGKFLLQHSGGAVEQGYYNF